MRKLSIEEKKNREKEQHRVYYLKNKEYIKNKSKLYHLNNRERVLKRNNNNYVNNKDKFSGLSKEYYQNNKENIILKSREYYNQNKEQIKQKQREDRVWKRFELAVKDRERYQRNKKEILKKMSDFAKQNRNIMNQKRIAYDLRNPQKSKARKQAYYKIKIPEDTLCVVCNENKATDRHHGDYSKPFDVEFVCHPCNTKLERFDYVRR